MARHIYYAYVTAIMVVAVCLSSLTIIGAFDTPAPMVVPSHGRVVEGHLPGNFNDSATLDTSQVETP